MIGPSRCRGFLLVDACIALALAGTLALAAAGIYAHVAAARAELDPALQARAAGSAAMTWLGGQIRQAGALLPPAVVDVAHPVAPAVQPLVSAEAAGIAGDRLLIHHESRTDCLGNQRASGQAYFDATRDPPVIAQINHIYVSRTATGGPSLMCDPDGSGSATAQAFAAQVEAMHLRFRLRGTTIWHGRAAVSNWSAVQAVEVCLVLSSGSATACPAQGGASPWPPGVLIGVFALRNAA
jgi:hypothetical protein